MMIVKCLVPAAAYTLFLVIAAGVSVFCVSACTRWAIEMICVVTNILLACVLLLNEFHTRTRIE